MSGVGLGPHVGISAPSEWVVRFAPFIRAAGRVLDLACGHGRHARFLAQLGYRVSAADRDEQALASLAGVPGIEVEAADLERGPWPYPGQRFAGIVVANCTGRCFPGCWKVWRQAEC